MPQASNLPVSYFWEYLVDTYATTQAVAVRRQAEARPDVITLGRMLVEMTADASKLTREFWVAMWGDDDPHETWIANRQKIRNKIFAESAGDHLDPAIPSRDLAHLEAVARSVKRSTWTKTWRTSDKTARPLQLTNGEIDDALDLSASS